MNQKSSRIGPSEAAWVCAVRRFPRDRLISSIEWGFIIAVLLVDLALSRQFGIGLTNASERVRGSIFVLALWPMAAGATRMTGFGRSSVAIFENLAKFFWLSLGLCIMSYFLAMSPFALKDSLNVEVDEYFGFRWPEFYLYIREHELIDKLFYYIYYSMSPQMLIILIFIGCSYPERPKRFITAFIISLSLTYLIFFLFPVAGPFVYFQHLDLRAAYYCLHFLGMRNHTMSAIPIDDLQGIIQFPSFHVTSAVILTYFLRRLPIISPIAVVTNVGMCIAALYVGGHYLSDALAGFVVGVVTIVIVRRLEGPGPEPRLAWRHPEFPRAPEEAPASVFAMLASTGTKRGAS